MKFTTRLPIVACAVLWICAGHAAELCTRTANDTGNARRFAPLALPAPNAFRDGSGRPGPAYWQQHVDYRIRATLDAASHTLSGHSRITYRNESPQQLAFLWLHLEQNRFRPDSRSVRYDPRMARRAQPFEAAGFAIAGVRVEQGGRTAPARVLTDDTRLRIELPEPLAPRGELHLQVEWSFHVPDQNRGRMGRLRLADGSTSYAFGQWFPRLAVYDDVRGWDPLPYLGQDNFHLEYGDYEVELTLPRELFVFATGELENPAEVLTVAQQRRLRAAAQGSRPVSIVSAAEIAGGRAPRPLGDGPLTWRFRARDVRDFAWTASSAVIWEAVQWRDTLVMAAYPPEARGDARNPGWERALEYALHALDFYSREFLPYPYPVLVNAATAADGMEYPMIHFSHPQYRGDDLFLLVDHEVAHNWVPMAIGADERRDNWFDEGLVSFMNLRSHRAWRGEVLGEFFAPLRSAAAFAEAALREPLGKAAPAIGASFIAPVRDNEPLWHLHYYKPAMAFSLLRDVVLGPERFDPALRSFFRAWQGRHPQPADFFRFIDSASGEDLAWFWRAWLFQPGHLDHAVGAVRSDGRHVAVTLLDKGGIPMPIDVQVRFADGTHLRRTLPVEIWFGGDMACWQIETANSPIEVVIDPDHRLPDVARGNDRWIATSGRR